MSFIRQFLLLIWKGWLMRRRHFIVTAIELLIPLLLTFLFVYLRSQAGPDRNAYSDDRPKKLRQNATFFPEETPFRRLQYNYNLNLIYSPNNSLSATLMENTLEKIKNYTGSSLNNLEMIGVNSEEELLAYVLRGDIKGIYKNYIGIVLQNIKKNDQVLPKSLNYKLRTNGYFQTNQKYEMFASYGPRSYDSYDNYDFMQWQACLDESFIDMKATEMKKENPIVKTLLQRFPFPSFIADSEQLTFLNFIPYVVVYGLSFIVPVFVKRIIDEKANRAKELMRMMGLTDIIYFLGTFFNTFIITLFIGIVMSILFTVHLSTNVAVIFYSSGSLFWFFLTIYMINGLVFCMALSAFFNKPVLGAIATYLIWCASHSVPTMLLDPIGTSKYAELTLNAKLATCLLPNCAFHWIMRIMSLFEASHEGASWAKINVPGSPADDFTLAMVLGMMLFSIVLYSFIFWYVDNVWPWQVGIAKNPAFIFMPSFWCPKIHATKGTYSRSVDEFPENKSNFEEPPSGQTPGIEIMNLVKVFDWGSSKKVAVDGVSLGMYQGHITVLLGHNGAGKTTVMNILTGLFSPSSGTARINGYDIVESTRNARESLGLCPQHNVLYDNLTVEEHLKFFAGLKGMPFSHMGAEVTSILTLLDLAPKRTTLARELSGGMKRKLSLGIALVAGSKVLVLDEPTSGMDPQARRAIWDMLQRVRHERTILLTTHYMEEADILGDRIAIMAEGKIQCNGSPMFLKKAFGAGYHLRIAKGENFDLPMAKSVIQEHIPDMYVESDSPTEVCFVLPTNDTEPFIPLFDELENRKKGIGYNSCGITITTMEDVFLKVGQIHDNLDKNENNNGLGAESNEPNWTLTTGHLQGSELMVQKCLALLLKRFHDAKRYWAFLLFQILLPIAVVSIMLVILNLIKSASKLDAIPLTLDVGQVFGESRGFYNGSVENFESTFAKTLDSYNAKSELVDSPMASALAVGEKNQQIYTHTIFVGGTMNKTVKGVYNLVSLYNGQPFHTRPMSINVMSTARLRSVTGVNDASITITNHPFPSTGSSYYREDTFLELPVSIMYAVFFPSALSFLSASFVLFPIHERITKSKLIQRMTGLGGLTFWLCHFVWDYLMVIVAATLFLIPFAAIGREVFTSDGILGALFLLVLSYGWCAIPFAYILSFIAKKPSSGFIIASSISSVSGLMLTLAVSLYKAMSRFPDDKQNAETIAWVFRILPDFSVTYAALKLHLIGEKNAFCTNVDQIVLRAICPVLANKTENSYYKCCSFDICGEDCFKRQPYVTFDHDSIGRELLFMSLGGFVFFGILILMETNLAKLWYILKLRMKAMRKNQSGDVMNLLDVGKINGATSVSEDVDVMQERAAVEGLCQRNQESTEALVVLDLTKHFSSLCAVDHLTFSVHNHECFGLLGVNGAGKTTTFSMLTGDLMVSGGNAFIQKYNLKDHLQQFQGYIGYCPQFDALLDRMTGREALFMFARLRGIPKKQMELAVNNMIDMIDLKAHADKPAEKYSGGNRRKLSLGLSLIGSPQVVFLDEPTAGVDPAARRKIWKALLYVQKHAKSSFILTTHSMEECEALCGRLAIMVNGQFRCMGSIQHLKSKFGQGYTIILKMGKAQDPQNPQQQEATVEALRQHMEKTFFNLTLKDYHQGLLHYHLMDTTVPWSQLFREMEKVKQVFCLEDYLVSDTTLEQIFLAFARSQRIVAA